MDKKIFIRIIVALIVISMILPLISMFALGR